ncbi:hypothetical protein PIB30_084034, partial [Stylosanthes scabra]|nr:hypothetical protein [Stylosanthes scabra]
MSLNPAIFKNGLPRSTWGVHPFSPFVDLIMWKSAGITGSPILTRIFSAIPTTDIILASAIVNISFLFLRGLTDAPRPLSRPVRNSLILKTESIIVEESKPIVRLTAGFINKTGFLARNHEVIEEEEVKQSK